MGGVKGMNPREDDDGGRDTPRIPESSRARSKVDSECSKNRDDADVRIWQILTSA